MSTVTPSSSSLVRTSGTWSMLVFSIASGQPAEAMSS